MSTKTTAKRLPAERGQGRKSLQGAGASPLLRVRVTPEQMAKATLGGPAWVRKIIDEAKLPLIKEVNHE